ncbi:MAG: hypothetical protein KJO69_06695 [Gammaproteobacteria bacterium]|nr:hypothetical protein [Gammaproteobacteria bacterium]
MVGVTGIRGQPLTTVIGDIKDDVDGIGEIVANMVCMCLSDNKQEQTEILKLLLVSYPKISTALRNLDRELPEQVKLLLDYEEL